MFTYRIMMDLEIGPDALNAAMNQLYSDLGRYNKDTVEIIRITMVRNHRLGVTTVTVCFN